MPKVAFKQRHATPNQHGRLHVSSRRQPTLQEDEREMPAKGGVAIHLIVIVIERKINGLVAIGYQLQEDSPVDEG